MTKTQKMRDMRKMRKMQEISLENKRVLIREDFNVPLKEGAITNDARIKAAIPTIKYALTHKAAVILLSHLGRPKAGMFDDKMSLAPIADKLSAFLGQPVRVIGLDNLDEGFVQPGEVVLLENVRFLEGEIENDPALGEKLASLCDVFVMDAFAVSHREQASTVGVAQKAKMACAGLLLQRELTALQTALQSPKRPVVAIVGGAKVSTKLILLKSLLDKVDTLIVGGGIANTFLAASEFSVGSSLMEQDLVPMAKTLLDKAKAQKKTILLPQDVMVANAIDSPKGQHKAVRLVEDNEKILDVGPLTCLKIRSVCQDAGTIIWNGPLGAFEYAPFQDGTKVLAQSIAESKAYSLAGGGDTIAAIEQYKVEEHISYISTGGGAFLAYLEGSILPGIQALLS